jgi:hypothetical protein
MSEADANDKALTQYFLRGMRRFARHVPDIALEMIAARIEAAYQLARSQFQPVKEDK